MNFAAGDSSARRILDLESPALALVFIAITAALLIADLDRPDRFYYILLKPNPRSWLIWGTWILMGAGLVATLWLASGLFARGVPAVLGWLAVAFGLGAACYSAMLFAQAKGRDLWQSPLFLWHLAVQAAMAGAAALILIDSAQGGSHNIGRDAAGVLPILLVLHTLIILAEMFLPKPSEDARRATRIVTHGILRTEFWLGAIGLGALLPFVLLLIGIARNPAGIAIDVVAALAALLGLLVYERIWIIAGQSVPLS
jgi:formate-dependent nitrite reductase membrane component NrfD